MRATPQWKVYEKQVFDHFKEHFPGAEIKKNVHVMGRFSRRKRQIDVLVIEESPAGTITTVVDTKFFGRKVDVKAVDAFAGFVDDVGAQRGMLITSRGYTDAALRRAFYGPTDLELDIVNFADLATYQGLAAVPYAGNRGFLVPAPFGWIIDCTRTGDRLANMYQRGLDLMTAMRKKEFLYLNRWDRKRTPITLSELDGDQVAAMRRDGGSVTVSYRPTVQRSDAETLLRIAEVERYRRLEITGFVGFEEVIFFAVLLTPKETQRSNIRRLESVLRQVTLLTIERNNTALIQELQKQLGEARNVSEKAQLLRQLGHWYRDMDEFETACTVLEESLRLEPGNSSAYYTIQELLPVLAALGNESRALEVMRLLLRLDPHNPTVFNDCFNFAAGWIKREDMLILFDDLKSEMCEDRFVHANCDFYAGNLLMADDLKLAEKRFIAATKLFRLILPRGHQVFSALRYVKKELRRNRERPQDA
jgi:tetratricopeptide (TPR) repeat protein